MSKQINRRTALTAVAAVPAGGEEGPALPADQVRRQLYELASEARLIVLAACAVNADQGADFVDSLDADNAFAIERAAARIEKSLLDLAGGSTFDRLSSLERKAVAS
jgi:hypothetical protein